MLSHSRGGTRRLAGSPTSMRWSRRRSTSPITAPARRIRTSTSRWSATSTASLAPIEVVPQDVTRVFLNLFGNGFYAASKRQLGGADAGYPADAQGLHARSRRGGRGQGARQRHRHPARGRAPSCSSRSSRPSRPAKAPGSACRSATTSSRSSMAARSRSRASRRSFTEFTVRLPRSQAALPQIARSVDERQHPGRR